MRRGAGLSLSLLLLLLGRGVCFARERGVVEVRWYSRRVAAKGNSGKPKSGHGPAVAFFKTPSNRTLSPRTHHLATGHWRPAV